MGQSPPAFAPSDSANDTSVRARVLRFLHDRHPAGMSKRVSAETMRATRGRGVPAATILQWERRGSDPSAGHLLTLGITYGIGFVAAVFVEVSAVEAAARAEELAVLEARVAALRAGVRR